MFNFYLSGFFVREFELNVKSFFVLVKIVRVMKVDVGIVYDGDVDRIGVVDD